MLQRLDADLVIAACECFEIVWVTGEDHTASDAEEGGPGGGVVTLWRG